MRNWSILLVSLAVVAGLTDCAGPPGAETVGEDVNLEPIETGIYSGLATEGLTFQLYTDSNSFGADYMRIHGGRIPRPPVPTVDFATDLVLGGFLGRKPSAGFGINMESARVIGTKGASWLDIIVTTTQPPEGAITAAVMTSPYSLVRISRGDWQGIRFRDSNGGLLEELPGPLH